MSRNAQVSRLLVLSSDLKYSLALIEELYDLCGDYSPYCKNSNDDIVVLSLQTKYYRASIEIHVHQVFDNKLESELRHDLCEYEAVICVVEDMEQERFWHVCRFVERIVDTSSYDVCLLVVGTSSATMEGTKQLEIWCQDNGFEFVAWNRVGKQTCSADQVIHEKVGVERVLEALHCNMWRSMEMNVSQAKTDALLEAATEDIEKKIEKKTSQVEKKKQDVKVEETGMSMDDSRLQTLLQTLQVTKGPTEVSTKDGEDDNKDNDAVDMTQFSALISEAQSVRNQGHSLTDEQRRDRAAEVAMKLWSLLGEEEESDVSESD